MASVGPPPPAPKRRTLPSPPPGKAMECVSLVGMAVGVDRFREDAHAVMNLLVAMQQQGFEDDDPTAQCVVRTQSAQSRRPPRAANAKKRRPLGRKRRPPSCILARRKRLFQRDIFEASEFLRENIYTLPTVFRLTKI